MSNLNQIEHKDLLFIKTNYENIYKEMEAQKAASKAIYKKFEAQLKIKEIQIKDQN